MTEKINRRNLGVFMTPDPIIQTPLYDHRHRSIVIEGPLRDIRRHVAGIILRLQSMNRTFVAMDAYRLVEIFLDKDLEFESSRDIAEYDLFVMLLGFGEVKNQRLPDLIVQVLTRRELKQLPTWVVLGLPIAAIAGKFDGTVAEIINGYQRVKIK